MQRSESLRNSPAGANLASTLVRHVDTLEWRQRAGMAWAAAFDAASGAEKLSLYAVRLSTGSAGPVFMESAEAVLYALTGRGVVDIGGNEFILDCGAGCHVRAGETFDVRNAEQERLDLLVAVCPGGAVAPWTAGGNTGMPADFDADHPVRVVSSVKARQESTGDRFFRILVGPMVGSKSVTQFIGSIPRSRAPEHYHEYEEVICVLTGEGRIWLGDEHAPVRPGSLVFLPRRQPHCMECVSDEGMELLGMFYPAGSPAVNYETQNEE